MMRVISSAVMLTLVLTSPAWAQATNAPEKKDQDKMICKSRPVMGSRLGSQRTCKTAQEWQELRTQTRQTIENSQRLWQKN